MELRDEARYLDLEELYKLCNDELRLRYARPAPAPLGLHLRGFSSGSSSASMRSVTTLRDIAEDTAGNVEESSRDSGFEGLLRGKTDLNPKAAQSVTPAPTALRGRTTAKKGFAGQQRAKPQPGWI